MAKTEKTTTFMDMYKKDKTICVLFGPETKHCVGLTIKGCDAHGKCVVADGTECKCAFYKRLEDEIRSRKAAIARCYDIGIAFQQNDRIDIDFEAAEKELKEAEEDAED